MILTTKDHLTRFRGLDKNLDIALHFIETQNVASLPLGCTKIMGDDVFVNHFAYESQNEGEGFLEGHKDYLDIHMVVTGREYLGYCDCSLVKEMQPYDVENDFYKYQGSILHYAYLDEHYLAITFPEDAHQPKILIDKPEQVDKLVFKVRLTK